MPRPERANDLPVSWDGKPVQWRGEWVSGESSLRFHTPLKDQACKHCGSLAANLIRSGMVTITLGYWPLVVFRCPDCWHDQVLDQRYDRLYDLEPNDYGALGSWDGDPTLDVHITEPVRCPRCQTSMHPAATVNPKGEPFELHPTCEQEFKRYRIDAKARRTAVGKAAAVANIAKPVY